MQQSILKSCPICQGLNPLATDTRDKTSCNLILGQKFFQEGYYLKAADAYKVVIAEHDQQDRPCLSRIYHKLGRTLYKGSNPKEAKIFLFKALELKKIYQEQDVLAIAKIKLDFGITCIDAAEYSEAHKHLEEAKTIIEKNYGQDHPDMAIYYNHLGELDRLQGKYPEALRVLEKSVEISSSMNNLRKNELGTSYYLMAWVYDFIGDNANGFVCASKALKMRKELYGVEHPEVAMSYNILGLIYQDQSKYQESLQCHYKALEIKQKFLGDQHSSLASTYNNIGMLQEICGEQNRALEYYQKCLEIDIANENENHPTVAATHCNLGDIYISRGSSEEAMFHYQKALTIRIQGFGEDHPQLSGAYDGIAQVHRMNGEYEKAKEIMIKSFKIKQAYYGEKNKEVADSYNDFANLDSDMQDYPKAFENYLKALKIRTELSEYHAIASSFFNFNILFQEVNDKELAKGCAIKANKIYKKILGQTHPDTESTKRKVRIIDRQQCRYNPNIDYL